MRGASTITSVIRWEDPPPASPLARPNNRGVPSRHFPLAGELRDNPGKWALIFEGDPGRATTLATNIRLGRVTPFSPAGEFDAVQRSRGSRVTAVYARYVGEVEGW